MAKNKIGNLYVNLEYDGIGLVVEAKRLLWFNFIDSMVVNYVLKYRLQIGDEDGNITRIEKGDVLISHSILLAELYS